MYRYGQLGGVQEEEKRIRKEQRGATVNVRIISYAKRYERSQKRRIEIETFKFVDAVSCSSSSSKDTMKPRRQKGKKKKKKPRRRRRKRKERARPLAEATRIKERSAVVGHQERLPGSGVEQLLKRL